MSEGQVSIDNETHRLPRPFMVIATQNPYEFEGTYPLPESQLDRFLFRLSLGYPDREVEREVLASHRGGEPVNQLEPVLEASEVLALQAGVRQVTVDESISEYLLDIVEATRRCEQLRVGASTRGALSLSRAAQSLALVEGRDYAIPDDVKRLAVPVLAHRVIPKGYPQSGQRQTIEALIQRLVDEICVPG
jgi:MoxR-like ATPase